MDGFVSSVYTNFRDLTKNSLLRLPEARPETLLPNIRRTICIFPLQLVLREIFVYKNDKTAK